jgi:hypothetical protein
VQVSDAHARGGLGTVPSPYGICAPPGVGRAIELSVLCFRFVEAQLEYYSTRSQEVSRHRSQFAEKGLQVSSFPVLAH